MPGNIFWQSGPVLSGFGTQLSGTGPLIAAAAAAQCSGDFFNNSVSGQSVFFVTAEFVASASGYGAAVQSQKTIDFYMIPMRDGVNLPTVDVTNESFPLNSFKGSFVTVQSGNITNDRMIIEGIPVTPVRYRNFIVNNLGQTITSGWSLFLDGYDEAYT